MTHETQTDRALTLNPVAMSCFAVAICAVATSLLGLVIPHFPAGGMAIVGMFYLVVGLFDLVLHPAATDDTSAQPATQESAIGERSHSVVTDARNTADNRSTDPHEGANKVHDRRKDLVEA